MSRERERSRVLLACETPTPLMQIKREIEGSDCLQEPFYRHTNRPNLISKMFGRYKINKYSVKDLNPVCDFNLLVILTQSSSSSSIS